MPVDQSGENILFLTADGQVEAHVQIQYTGDPERFAWLVPVPAIPELEVGSQQLFINLLNATVPTFSITTTADVCASGIGSSGPSSSSSVGCSGLGGSADSTLAGGGAFQDQDDFEENGPQVVLKQAVGAFDVTVLQGDTVEELTTWLDTNGFDVPDDAGPILGQYVDAGHYFMAIRLTPGAGVDEIHPFVMRYEGDTPAIPIKLTRVAATDDMPVRAFFLGDGRYYPSNYHHVTVNELQFDWINVGSNYADVISRAVDDPAADGHAFVTEYSGASNVVSRTGLRPTAWDADVFRAIDPVDVIEELERQGLVSCQRSFQCGTSHALVLPLLREFLPAPAMDEGDFYSCLGCNSHQIDLEAWDGEEFADAFFEQIVAPGAHAEALLSRFRHLTRLFTTISPAEMTVDPTFVETSQNSAVSTQLAATTRIPCVGPNFTQVPGGDVVALQGSWPAFGADMPVARTVELYDARGTATIVADHSTDVDDAIGAWNDLQGFDGPPPAGSNGSATPSSSFGGDSGGCACSVPAGREAPAYGMLGFVAVALLRRARSRRRSSPAC